MRLNRLPASFCASLIVAGSIAWPTDASAQMFDCSKIVNAVQRLLGQIQQEQADPYANWPKVDTYQPPPEPWDWEKVMERLAHNNETMDGDGREMLARLARGTVERTAESGEAVNEVVTHATFSAIKPTAPAGRIWAERTKAFSAKTAAITSLSHSFQPSADSYQTLIKDMREYQAEADKLLNLIDEHGDMMPSNVPIPNTMVVANQLGAMVEKVGLDADRALETASLAAGDLNAARLYDADAAMRLRLAKERLGDVNQWAGAGCPADAPAPAQNAEAPTPQPPADNGGHHISGAKWAAIGGVVAGAGVGLGYAVSNMAPLCCAPNPDICVSQKSSAIAAANNASATCVGASSAQIIACNQAGATLVTAVTNYCSCQGSSVAIPGNASYSTVITMINNGTACR